MDQNKTDDIALIGIVEELHSCGCDPGLDGFWDLEGGWSQWPQEREDRSQRQTAPDAGM